MKFRHARSVGATVMSLCALQGFAHADPPAGGNWSANPTFIDDFSGSSLDTTKWSKGYRYKEVHNLNGNFELQGFVPENVTVSGGYCYLKAEKRPVLNTNMNGWTDTDHPRQYASGAIQTYTKWAQAYGYFEARVKLPGGPGSWPAFWLMPDRGPSYTEAPRVVVGNSYNGVSVPMGNEIDIFEIMGTWKDPSTGISPSKSGFFWGYNSQSWGQYAQANNGAGPGEYQGLVEPDTTFHTYGLAWGPGKLDWYIDGVKVVSREEPVSMTNIGSAPNYIILNYALHTNDWKNPNPVPIADIDAALPRQMVIDYVKVWSGTPALNPAPVAAGTYRITPKSDANKCLEVFGASTADSANVEISDYTGAPNQQWALEYLGGSVYEIKAVHSGKVLNLAGGSGADNTNVDQLTDSNIIGQRWKFEPVGTSGYFRLTPLVNSVRSLTTYGTANNSNAYSFWYSSMPGQQWKFQPVSTVPAGTEVIVDNSDTSGVTIAGTWPSSTWATSQYYDTNYVHDDNTLKGSKSVKFTPTLPVTGTYKVYAMWNGTTGSRATNAPFTINYSGGSATVTKDQCVNSGVWNLLGTYNFASGTSGNVVLSNSGTTNYVVADAVKFVLQ